MSAEFTEPANESARTQRRIDYHLEEALARSEDREVRYHLREALQLFRI